eukprot:CAMPEP_0172441218 /NCGR_PEP_ID=MMETSP1065-20121228/1797_1 /TAXON_ID=265537 /ORGANISM="Amphiprora paludosa, Strain CCMP125" /LENGTH=38 /DNA_ID= /DNA_START= /DNA_END= /DNA_ORIENTATION=
MKEYRKGLAFSYLAESLTHSTFHRDTEGTMGSMSMSMV